MLNLFRSKKITERLSETRDVRIFGVKFKIRRLNALDYLDGSRAMVQVYNEYQISKGKKKEPDAKQIKKHLTDVIMAGVVEPKLKRKEDEDGLLVDNLFTDIDLANELYTEIMLFTYGKKKA